MFRSKMHIERLRIEQKAIERRISIGESKESYQVAIKELVVEILDDKNIITVCRVWRKGSKYVELYDFGFRRLSHQFF